LQFETDKDTALTTYNGCYDIVGKSDKRYIYYGNERNKNRAKIGYCNKHRRWVLFVGDNNTASEAFGTDNEIARSPKTDRFDIESVTDGQWVDAFNFPIGLSFSCDDDSYESCDTVHSSGEGMCDIFRNYDAYNYDWGNCCSFSCTAPDCGKVHDSVHERLYPNCLQQPPPGFVPISIHLGNIDSQVNVNEGHLFELQCDERTIFRKYMKSFENISDFVNIGASCSFSLNTPQLDEAHPELSFKVFYGNENHDNDFIASFLYPSPK